MLWRLLQTVPNLPSRRPTPASSHGPLPQPKPSESVWEFVSILSSGNRSETLRGQFHEDIRLHPLSVKRSAGIFGILPSKGFVTRRRCACAPIDLDGLCTEREPEQKWTQ